MTHGPVGDSSSGLDYEESEHSGRVVRIASVAALGGLLFGYDSAVINGAVSAIQQTFHISNAALGFAVASALLGAAAGAMTAGRLADKIGRLAVMKIAALLFLISAIGAGLSPNVWLVVIFRIIGGIGVGVASVIAPAYIAETSPPRIRGRLGSLQQLAIVTGIFLSLAIDYGLSHLAGGSGAPLWFGLEAWRWMFIVMMVPAIVYGGLAYTIPESPRYLVAKYRIPEARKVLSLLLGEKNLEITITRIQESLKAEKPPSWRDLRKPTGGLYGIVWVGLGLSVFQQFVGINVIFYYSNVLWEAVGFGESAAFLITVITSITNILTTLIAIALIDKVGRPLIVFDYTSGHGRDGPQNFLRNFRGYLQADAAPIYDNLFNHPRQLILEVGCWMHGRRNFFEDRATDRPRAELVLARIWQLYAVESELKARCANEWRDLPREELEDRIVDVRQERSVPVLTALHAWLEVEKPKLLPKAALRGAMDYLLNHWQALVRYTTDGKLAIDNGAAERALRGLTIGRRNWLFCGSERGAQAAAVHFSLIASCHRHGLDSFAYLRDVLTRLPRLGAAPSRDDLLPLLPDRWTKQ